VVRRVSRTLLRCGTARPSRGRLCRCRRLDLSADVLIATGANRGFPRRMPCVGGVSKPCSRSKVHPLNCVRGMAAGHVLAEPGALPFAAPSRCTNGCRLVPDARCARAMPDRSTHLARLGKGQTSSLAAAMRPSGCVRFPDDWRKTIRLVNFSIPISSCSRRSIRSWKWATLGATIFNR
jgi:hypothetical protein